jgi:hypothetical protein
MRTFCKYLAGYTGKLVGEGVQQLVKLSGKLGAGIFRCLHMMSWLSVLGHFAPGRLSASSLTLVVWLGVLSLGGGIVANKFFTEFLE